MIRPISPAMVGRMARMAAKATLVPVLLQAKCWLVFEALTV